MEQRGPAAHAQGNDAAILFSFRGILVGILPLPTPISSTPMLLVITIVLFCFVWGSEAVCSCVFGAEALNNGRGRSTRPQSLQKLYPSPVAG